MSAGRDPQIAVERALAVVADREPVLRAWAHLDESQARDGASRASDGPLHGVICGVKDIFDTADWPTEYGSPIYRGYRPRADAAAVALLVAAGAVVLGKTVTAELAWASPGPTTNPWRPSHTPGGSSSGSAAAVAAGMVDLALGTQTAGSVIRPASFCGVLGFKPTFGDVPTAGVKVVAPSLDTVGVFAATHEVLEAARLVLTGRSLDDDSGCPIRFGLLRTEQWSYVTPDGRRAVESAAELLAASERELPDALVGLADDALIVLGFEGARSLTWERQRRSAELSLLLRQRLEAGSALSVRDYDRARSRTRLARSEPVVDALFADVDVLVTPAATGEAPEGLGDTGDPRFCRLWTLLGWPTLSVPGLTGATGLPVGVQLVGRPGQDSMLLRAGRLLGSLVEGGSRVGRS